MERRGERALPAGRREPSANRDASLPPRLSESRRHRLRQLRAFCHVARLRSISKAAERVFCSQPAVSMQIRALEEELNFKLLERRGPNIALTPAGRRFYRLAAPLVKDFDRLPDTFAEQYRGVTVDVHVAAGEIAAAVLLPRYLKRFAEQLPHTKVTVRTGTGSECLRWLRGYEVDLVVSAMDVEPPDLKHYPVIAANYVLIAPEAHPLAGHESISLDDVSAHPLVAHTSGTYARQFGEMYLRQHRIPFRVDVEIDGWDAIKAYVEAGLGIAIVPDVCLDERDRVLRFPFGFPVPPRIYGAITRREGILPRAVRQIIRIMDPARPGKC